MMSPSTNSPAPTKPVEPKLPAIDRTEEITQQLTTAGRYSVALGLWLMMGCGAAWLWQNKAGTISFNVIRGVWNGAVNGFNHPVGPGAAAATNADADATVKASKADLDSLATKQDEKRAEDLKKISEKLDALQKMQAEANKK